MRVSRRNVLGVGEHVLPQVVLPDEGAVAQVTLELLARRVDDHVGLHVGLLREGLLAHIAPVVLLTWKDNPPATKMTINK